MNPLTHILLWASIVTLTGCVTRIDNTYNITAKGDVKLSAKNDAQAETKPDIQSALSGLPVL